MENNVNYVDSRTDEEKLNEPETVVSTASAEEELEIESARQEVEAVEQDDKPKFPEGSPLRRLVMPHRKVSRQVTEADVERVIEEAKILHAICFERFGLYHGAYAMHHSQIENEDPLDFFVTQKHKIIINPVIKEHSNYTVDHTEGCVTYPGEAQAVVQRWQKIEVEYVTIMTDPDKNKFVLSSVIQDSLSGMEAKVFQHESDHGKAKYVHDLPTE